jgi:hypothetical protein
MVVMVVRMMFVFPVVMMIAMALMVLATGFFTSAVRVGVVFVIHVNLHIYLF